jgi:urease accessory protein
MVTGDQYDVQVRIGDGATAFVGTQASTKIYKNPDARRNACGQTTRAEVGTGGLLVWTPDPVQPFAGSRFRQRQKFHLAEGAGLVFLDSVTAGRSERGEHWAFSEYASRSEVWVAGKRLVIDSLQLQSEPGRITVGQRMGSCQMYAVLMILGTELEALAQTLLARVSALPARSRDGLQISGSAVPGGGLFRLASPRVESVRQCLAKWLSALEGRLGDNSWARKW